MTEVQGRTEVAFQPQRERHSLYCWAETSPVTLWGAPLTPQTRNSSLDKSPEGAPFTW